MGLDIGEKRTGVAVSDPMGIMAQPLTVIESEGAERDAERIIELAKEKTAAIIVVGIPYDLDGMPGKSAQKTLAFAELLKKKILEKGLSISVDTWDERLSTVAVERTLIEGAVKRKKRKIAIDKLAASYILQGYLDAHRGG
jgi:putative Holliday junction resolvase